MLKRIDGLLARPRAPLWLGLAAVLLCLPSLRFGLQADDHMFPWKLQRGEPAWSLFQLRAEEVPDARADGSLAWWSSPHLEGKFFRPLASLSHALEFRAWPHAVWLMRGFNILLYGASVALAALLYRRLAPSLPSASLASLLFLLDDGHAFSVGWISGRNTVLALLFSLLALLFHLRATDSQRRGPRLLSAACVALALLSAEAGVWALALLLSHVLIMESGSPLTRLRSIAAPLLVGVAWALVYVGLDSGFRGSSFYRDPSAPVSALTQGMLDLPIWFTDLFGPGGLPLVLLFPSLWVRLGTLPIGLMFLWFLLPALRSSRECRFFAVASMLCLVPLLCTLPTARVLLGPSFGAMGWIGCAIAQGRVSGGAHGRWGARVLLLVHVGLASLLFYPALRATQAFAYGTSILTAAVEPRREVILVQSPVELISNYTLFSLTTSARAGTAPRSLHQLYTGRSELWVERIDAHTLEIESVRGWGYAPLDRIFCAPEDMPALGSEVRLPAFSARVLRSTEAGMPQRVRFSFPTPLESRERQWLTWEQNRVVAFTPPPLGKRVRLTPLSFPGALRP